MSNTPMTDAVAYAVQVEQYIDKLRADGVIADLGLLDDRPAHEVPANIDEVIAETENTQTENDLLKQRVAELEAENERLRIAIAALRKQVWQLWCRGVSNISAIAREIGIDWKTARGYIDDWWEYIDCEQCLLALGRK
jgi:hypothetical protein